MNSIWQDVRVAVRLYAQEAALHDRRARHPRAGDRRQQRDLQRRQRRAAAPARVSARLRAGRRRPGHDRHAVAAADLAAELLRSARRDPRVFGRGRVLEPERQHLRRRRRAGEGARGDLLERSLRRARRQARRRPRLRRRGRRAGRDASGDPRARVVEAALRRRSGGDRPRADARRRAHAHRRRDAAGIRIPGRGHRAVGAAAAVAHAAAESGASGRRRTANTGF